MLARQTSSSGSPPLPDQQSAVRHWVEGLVSGHCTEGDFLSQVLLLTDEDADAAWEVLALLDQFHRRRQLDEDLFKRMKLRLQQECLGYGEDVAAVPITSNPAQRTAQPGRAQPQCGDLLKGRYRVTQIRWQARTGTFLIDAIDEVRAHLRGGQQHVLIHLLTVASVRETALVQRIYRLQALAHPAISRVFDVDEEDGAIFFTMECPEGASLQQLMQSEGTLTAGYDAPSILTDLASALMHAHAHGVPHGDVSPANVLLTDSREVRLHGFVMGVEDPPTVDGDCIAFAALARQLLSKPYLGNVESRLLQSALREGDTNAARRLVASFAAGLSAPQSANAPSAPDAGARSWSRPRLQVAAAAAIVAVMGAGGHLLLNGNIDRQAPDGGSQVATAAPAGASLAAWPQEKVSFLVPASMASIEAEPALAEVQLVQADSVPSPAEVARAPIARPQVLDLPGGMVRVEEGETVAKIWVRRQGSLRGPATFFWWTEPGSARESRDFAQILRRWEVIPDGAAGIELHVPLVKGSTRAQTRNFYVKIDRGSSGAALGIRTIAQVEIVPRRPEAVAANIIALSN